MSDEDYNPEHDDELAPTYPLLSDKQYNLLKRFQIILLPGLAALVAGFMTLFDIPGVDKVTGTAVLVATFTGVVLAFAGRAYDKAVLTGTVEK